MSQLEAARNLIHARIVYWGPSGSGKTTCLEALRQALDPEDRFRMYSVANADGTTLSFDVLPIEDFKCGHFRVRARAVAVPGADERIPTRLALLRDADVVVFVADARSSAVQANVASLQELRGALDSLGIDRDAMPVVWALNKQDLASGTSSSELCHQLGVEAAPTHETVATDGRGVLEAFGEAFRLMVGRLVATHAIENADPAGAEPDRLLPQLVRGVKRATSGRAEERRIVVTPATTEGSGAAGVVEAQMGLVEEHIASESSNRMLEDRNRELMAVNRVARSILSAMDADNLLVVLLDATAEHLGVSYASCVLFDHSAKGTLRTHVLGFGRDPVLGLADVAAARYLDLLDTSDGPVPVEEARNPDLFDAVRMVDRRVRRAMYQPIKNKQGRPVGWVGIYACAEEPRLATQQLLFLSSISRLAALGLDKIELLDKLQQARTGLDTEVRDRTGQLEMANARIRALNRGLESRVTERTRALEEQNRQLKQARAKAVHDARLGGMGELAASFAYEVTDPVAGLVEKIQHMQGCLDELRARIVSSVPQGNDGLGAIAEFEEMLAGSRKGAERMAAVVSSLQRFSGQKDSADTFSLNAVVADAVALLEERIAAHAELDLRVTDLPDSPGDGREMSHVALVLLTNAVEAIERKGERGKITVTTFEAGGKVTLAVKDDGCGMDEDLLARALEPFVTTKEGESTAGLGLHSAHQAVEQLGGTLRLRSKAGEGTTVTVVLPLPEEEPAVSAGDDGGDAAGT